MADETDEALVHVLVDDQPASTISISLEADSAGFVTEIAPDLGVDHVLISIHGIRDNGSFAQEFIDADILTDLKIKLVQVRYARQSVMGLLFGHGWTHRSEDVEAQLVRIHEDHPDVPISILCHSYGSHLVLGMLDRLPFRPRNIVLAGSICRMQMANRLPRGTITVNDVGKWDPWPVIAELFRPDLHQATGTFGFQRYPVLDRHFSFGHAGALEREHVRRYVLPIIATGAIKRHDEPLPSFLEAIPHYLRRILVFGPYVLLAALIVDLL